MQKTYIHEYPHPRVIIHYHPAAGEQLTLDHVQFALLHELHAIELDLHYREDGQIVANHDGPTAASPTLDQAIQRIVKHANGDTTVHHDQRQFFLVLEPKEKDARLFNAIVQILGEYTAYLSTAVRGGDPPRGMTVVITGDYVQQFAAHFASSQRNRLCIVEGYDYSDEIINLSDDQAVFQWVESIRHDRERGRINALHAGTDPHIQGMYNVRVWDCQTYADLGIGLASGADALNVDYAQVAHFKQMLGHQSPRGAFPSVSIQGSQVLLTWRDPASNNLYMALGRLSAAGLHFSRQILLTSFLGQMPLAMAPAAALSPDGRLLIAYQGADHQRLWYISGRFTSVERFLTFQGTQHRLMLPSDPGRYGINPAVATSRDRRTIVAYERANQIWYLSGFIDAAGALIGQEYRLVERDAGRGAMPSIAIDTQDRVIVAYSGADSATLWYVAGTIDGSGKIIGREYALTEGQARRGVAPSVAFSTHNQVILAYQGTDSETLWYVSGTLDQQGAISGREFSLTEGAARRGRHPTVAVGAAGEIVIVYEGLADQKLWYLHGRLDRSGRVKGREHVLDIGMDRR